MRYVKGFNRVSFAPSVDINTSCAGGVGIKGLVAALLLPFLILSSCTKDNGETPKPPDKKPAVATPGALPETGAIKKVGEITMPKDAKIPQETVAKAEKVAKEIEKTVSEAAKKAPVTLDDITEPAMSIDAVKKAVGSVTLDQLKEAAEILKAAVTNSDVAVKALNEQIKELEGNPLAAGLKQQLESTLGQFKGLKEKFRIVVDALKEKGVDVSQYLGLLGTE